MEADLPLFHFNSLTGDLFLPAPEGEELPNVDSAREVATVLLEDLLDAADRLDAFQLFAPPDSCLIARLTCSANLANNSRFGDRSPGR
jgi:hypothetical protein